MDETYIQVGGQWKYLYRAVDRLDRTVDFLLAAKCYYAAARRYFERAIGLHDMLEKITIDKSGANTAAVLSMIAEPSSAERDPCWDSKNFFVPQKSSPALKQCT